MSNHDRLSGLDASFLQLEEGGAHMHVGSCMLFDGVAPAYGDFVAQLERRLHLVPRYRQKLAFVPLSQARPVWVDDSHFNAQYHIRHSALPDPAGMDELRALTGRVLSGRLDRSKPLWEVWLVDRVAGDRFAVISKTHHCLVDGVSGVDITTVLFDLEPQPPEGDHPAAPLGWEPRPEPSSAALLADAMRERVTAPLGMVREVGGAITKPVALAERATTVVTGLGAIAMAGMNAPPSPYNTTIGPHRRFAWVEEDLARLRAVKAVLGGTVNDVVLTAVTGALRSHLLSRRHELRGLTLRAMVPVSVRAQAQKGVLGNRVSAMYAPLPVSVADPAERYEIVRVAMAGLKESGQAVGAEVLTRLTGFAPPTVMAQAARLQARQRMFNLTVTNVPGPQFPLYLLGRHLERIFPQVPLAGNAALGVAVMSYDGTMNFGLIGDYDVLPDLDQIADALRAAIDELSGLAGGSSPSRATVVPRPTSPAPLTDVPRLAAVALGAVVLLAGLYGLSALISSRDDAGVERSAGPGSREADRGAAHEGVKDRSGPRPPTSGPHEPDLVTRDARELSDDQILHALELGDVVLAYPDRSPPTGLRALADEVAGPFDPELAAAGQAVVLARVRGASGVQALAWRRRLKASGPDDPDLRRFAEYWLGRGVGGSR